MLDEHHAVYVEQVTVSLWGGLPHPGEAQHGIEEVQAMWSAIATATDNPELADLHEYVVDVERHFERFEAGEEWAQQASEEVSSDISSVAGWAVLNCGDGYALAAADPEPEPEDAPTSGGAEPSEPAALLSDSWIDDDGYSFTFELTAAVSTATTDVANARPGQAEIKWGYSFTGVIANATPERNASVPEVHAQPVWPSSSVICTLGIEVRHGFSYPRSDDEDKWCTLEGAPWTLRGNSDDLAEGAAVAVQASPDAVRGFEVPEADVERYLSELRSPIWAIARDQGPNDAGGCTTRGGQIYVSKVTTDTGCGV